MKRILVPMLAIGLLAGCTSESEPKVEEPKVEVTDNEVETKINFKILVPNDELTTGEPTTFTVDTKDYPIRQEQMKAVLNEALKDLGVVVDDVSYNDAEGGTVNIDISEESLQKVSSSAQIGLFSTHISYVMYKNFIDVPGYYITTDGKPAYLSEVGELTEIHENKDNSENYYITVE